MRKTNRIGCWLVVYKLFANLQIYVSSDRFLHSALNLTGLIFDSVAVLSMVLSIAHLPINLGFVL